MKKRLLFFLTAGLCMLTVACGASIENSAENASSAIESGENKEMIETVEEFVQSESEADIAENETEDISEPNGNTETDEISETEELADTMSDSFTDYTGIYEYQPEDVMSGTCHTVEVTGQNGDEITFTYYWYSMRSANEIMPRSEILEDGKCIFEAGVYGGHGADGQVSEFAFEFVDENTLIVSDPEHRFEVTLTRTDSADSGDDALSEENEFYEAGYNTSESEELSTDYIIGEFTSDNGNVYSVNFYTSGDPGSVGVIYLNHDQMGSSEESMEILYETTNVYRVVDTQNYFVFDYDGTNYTLTYYKDGKVWEKAERTKSYSPS